MIMKLNERLNRCATTLEDGKLLAKLSACDVVTQELKYHSACLTTLYNRERAHLRILQSEQFSTDSLGEFYLLTFSEFIIYIMDMNVANEETNPRVFRFADLVSLYKEHDVASTIGQEKTRSILFFHAFSGCDVVSAFHEKGKKTA